MPRKNLKGYIFSETIVGWILCCCSGIVSDFPSFVLRHLVNETSAIPKQIPTFPSQNIQYLQRKTTMFCFVFKKSWELFSYNSRTVTTRIQEPLWLRTGQAKITSPFYKTLFNLTSCTESYLAKKCKEFLKSYILILTRNISNLSLFQSLQYKEKKNILCSK